MKRKLSVACFILFCVVIFYLLPPRPSQLRIDKINIQSLIEIRDNLIQATQIYIGNQPKDSDFGKLGARTEELTKFIAQVDILCEQLPSTDCTPLQEHLEKVVSSSYSFLINSRNPDPFRSLRQRFTPGSKGIVIAAGQSHFRYLCHLLVNLRTVLRSTLPITVVYAGEEDLPKKYRDILTSQFPYLETLDILTVNFGDEFIDFPHGNWAIKPFAYLAAPYESVIGIDADAVFLQNPEILLTQKGFVETGTLLFHDRLLWPNLFKKRAQWWRDEMEEANRQPSHTLRNSKVWKDGYAEECDSGVLVLDKGRLPILMALLHIAWQNSKGPREAYTYRLTYGDKETWWFGLELSGVQYTFEKYYGSMIGEKISQDDQEMVCSFAIAHLDEKEKLLWFNGSLLKNKAVNLTEFLQPNALMIDGLWLKGSIKRQSSCMKDSQIMSLDDNVNKIMTESIDGAKKMDEKLMHLGIDLKITTGIRG